MCNSRFVSCIAALLAIGSLSAAARQVQPGIALMRQKLDFSRGILEGLSLEKFELIVTNAAMLRDMTVTNAFPRLKNPQYEQKLRKFQAKVDRLVVAGKNRNLDKAFAVYSEIIESCVACHRQVRHEQFTTNQGQDLRKSSSVGSATRDLSGRASAGRGISGGSP